VAGPIQEILEICKKHNVVFGTTASSTEAARQWVSQGAQFFETVDEFALIAEGAAKLVREYRSFTKLSKME